MFNQHDLKRDEFMLDGPLKKQGYDWWWHSFTAVNERTGKETPFFIEYFVCNPALGGAEPVFGQLPSNKEAGVKPSYFMVKAGCWGEKPMQLHRFFGWDQVNLHKKVPFSVEAADCYCDDTFMQGSVSISEEEAKEHPEWMCDGGEMEWKLNIDKKISFNVGYGAGTPLRVAKAFEMYWHAEGMKTAYEGTITANGEKYIVKPESCYGYADKNWGSNFTSPWVWLSSNCLKSKITGKKLENSVFDIGGGRPKVYFVPLNNILLGAFYYEGKEYEYNFSKFWTKPSTQFSCRETVDEIQWYVRQENQDSVMVTKVRCKKKHMLLVNYESPDGEKRHNKLFNGGDGIGNIKLYKKIGKGLELIDDIDVSHIGCEYGEYC